MFDPDAVVDGLKLILQPGDVFEFRALDVADGWRKFTVSGYFDDPEKLRSQLAEIQRAKGVYFTLNPVDPPLLHRGVNRLKQVGKDESTGDSNILCRRWLPIDIDPNRVTGISSTDEEHDAAVDLMRHVDLYLHDLGFPEGIHASSGNGAHLLYRVDLPADDGGLVKRVLESLSAKFTNKAIKVDTSVFNPARIWKLYGSLVCKGDDTEERPHRYAEIISAPPILSVVPIELLEQVAGEVEATTATAAKASQPTQPPGAAYDVAGFIERNRLDVSGPSPYAGGQRWTFDTSPMCQHHGDGPVLIQFPSGAVFAKCAHDSCTWGWKDLRSQFEEVPSGRIEVPEKNSDSVCLNSDKQITPPRPLPTFAGIDAADLEQFVNEPTEWIVDGILSADQPTIFGARSKAGKTTQLVDLVASLATATPWLGTLPVSKPRKALFITGESSYKAISKRIYRACHSRGYGLADVRGKFRVEAVEFPQLPNASHRASISETVAKYGMEVVIIDPLYRGLGGLDTARVNETGQAIVEFAQACQPASLIISHHCIKAAAREYGEPLALEDLTGAGVAESCGNWWLVSRNTEYAHGKMHDLCVVYGGRDEQSGVHRILFDEANWQFTIDSQREYKQSCEAADALIKQTKKSEVEQQELDIARAKIKAAMANQKKPSSKTDIKTTFGGKQNRFGPAFAAMLQDMTIVERPYVDSLGRRQSSGYILGEYAPAYDAETSRNIPEVPGPIDT